MPVRITGPYKHRSGVRFRVITGPGAHTWAKTRPTESEARLHAEALADGLQAQIDLTVWGLCEKYLARLVQKGNKDKTIVRTRAALRRLLEPVADHEAASINQARARATYEALTQSTVRRPRLSEAQNRESMLREVIDRQVRDLANYSGPRLDSEEIRRRREELRALRARIGKEPPIQRGDSDWLRALCARSDRRAAARLGKKDDPAHDLISAATHQQALIQVVAAWKWGIRQGIVKTNPWLDVDKIGKANTGKPQLRVDESRKLADVCMEHVMTDDGALAVLMAQFMGLRVGEIAARIVRDVDQDCTVLVVEDAKSKNGVRQPEIPDVLQPAIRLRCEGRSPLEPLLRTRAGNPMHQKAIARALADHCELAEVPRVVPHALRGGFASTLVEAGAQTHIVAAIMGHGSFERVTAKHYVSDEAKEKARAASRGRHLKLV